jgi:5-formyltetrahydrofolate cyclo-ligase
MTQTIDVRPDLRREMRRRRTALDARERMQASMAVAAEILAMPEFGRAGDVAIYWAVRSELPLLHSVTALGNTGHRLSLPMVQVDGTLRFGRWRSGASTQPNRFGIPEPLVEAGETLDAIDLDVILVPLVAFDMHGGRLGSGAGFYDRSFAFLLDRPRPARPFLLGIGYAFQQVPELPVETWDVPLDAVVTERELLRVSRP